MTVTTTQTLIKRGEIEQVVGEQTTEQLEGIARTAEDKPVTLGFDVDAPLVGYVKDPKVTEEGDIVASIEIDDERYARMLSPPPGEPSCELAPAFVMGRDDQQRRIFERITSVGLVNERMIPESALEQLEERERSEHAGEDKRQDPE